MRKLLFLALMIFCCTSPVWSAEPAAKHINRASNYLAVLDIDISSKIDQDVARPLSDSIRKEILMSGKYEVIDRGNMDKIMKEQAFQMTGCTSKECAVEVGQVLGVGKIVIGSLGKVGKMYYLSLSLVNVETAKTERVEDDSCMCEMEDLVESSKRTARKLMAQAGTPQVDRTAQEELPRKKPEEPAVKQKDENDWLAQVRKAEILEQKKQAEAEQSRKIEDQKKQVAAEQSRKVEAQKKQARWDKQLKDEIIHVDLGLSFYEPHNKVFSDRANGISGFSLRTDLYKYYFVGVDYVGGGDATNYLVKVLSAGVQYPYFLGDRFNVCAGLGARLESISVNKGDATFGNNSGLAFIGFKYRFTPGFGFYYNYGETFSAKYSDYAIQSFGLFMAF